MPKESVILLNFYSRKKLMLLYQQILHQKSNSDKMNYILDVINRIKVLLSEEQIGILGPKLSELIEADGIVMTAEMEIAKLVESQLGINISVDENI